METALRKPGGLDKFQVTDREECGVIIERHDPGEPSLLYILKVPNHATRADRFAIKSFDVGRIRRVLGEGESIVGFMHTHLPDDDCEPSDRDFEGAALNPEMEHLIYQPSTKRWVWFGPEVTDTT